MELSREKCTLTLILASIIVLLAHYSILIFDGLSFEFGIFSFSNIKASAIFWPVASLAIVAGSLLCHITKSIPELSPVFSGGYQENPHYIELVRSLVTLACGSNQYGSPRGGLRHSFFRCKNHNIGSFMCPNNTRSEQVIVYPSMQTHIRCVLSGVKNCLMPRLWFDIYFPAIFGVWALCIILVV